LRASLEVDQRFIRNPRQQVVLLDDVLTTGCSFKACYFLGKNPFLVKIRSA
jgi:predicted amidophosphoribosyltransferase